MTPMTEHPGDWAQLRARIPQGAKAVLRRAARLGFIGPMDLDDQIDHALGFVVVCEGERPEGLHTALDLGTGGGLPGLVLGSCWPGCRVVLVEANQRRTDFLASELADDPVLGQVEVVRGRAEDLARDPTLRGQFEAVTSRSFGPPGVTAECGSPFLALGGLMVVSEPPDEEVTGRWPDEGLGLLGLENRGRVRVGARYGYQLLEKAIPSSDRYPRRSGMPAKRRLF